MVKYPIAKNQENPHRKMHHWQMVRQTDGQMKSTDFIRPLPQRWRFDHVFWKFKNEIFLNYLA